MLSSRNGVLVMGREGGGDLVGVPGNKLGLEADSGRLLVGESSWRKRSPADRSSVIADR